MSQLAPRSFAAIAGIRAAVPARGRLGFTRLGGSGQFEVGIRSGAGATAALGTGWIRVIQALPAPITTVAVTTCRDDGDSRQPQPTGDLVLI